VTSYYPIQAREEGGRIILELRTDPPALEQ